MTATEELRRMLDERGVEHHDGEIMTYADGVDFMPSASGTLDVTLYGRTPAQAIAATLGRGTCHLEINTSMTAVVCDRCNYPMPRGTVLTEVHFCPNCGKEVVDG